MTTHEIDPADVKARFDAVVAAMRAAQVWDIERPDENAFVNMGAFGGNTMWFGQWLRWVFVPRVEETLANGGPWPSNSQVATRAVREGDTDEHIASLVGPLAEFDALFRGDAD